MIGEPYPKTKTEYSQERENPWSRQVIDLVVMPDLAEDKQPYLSETGLFQRQTHDKASTHYVVAFNPHGGQEAAECFVLANGGPSELKERFKWLAVQGPSDVDLGMLNDLLHQFEKLIRETGDEA
jgi:hypothetical protein